MSRPGVTRARLTQFEVRRALKSVMSEIPAARLRHIDEGADLDAWAVDEAWVARFSLDEEIGANLDREIALLEQIRHDMPIPCPEHVAVGGMDDAYPFRFTVSKMLPGISGEVLRPGRKRWPGLADQLAGFLSTLHATPLEVGAAAGLMHDRNVLPLAELADEAAVALDARTLDAFPLAAQGGAARFAAELATPPDHAKPPDVVAHSDVKPEHLLLTEDGARITAVLDWADTCLTPAEIDLAGPSSGSARLR